MAPKRKASSSASSATKKSKSKGSANIPPPQEENINWREKSIREFNLQIADVDHVPTDDEMKEWKIYHVGRTKAKAYHDKTINDGNDETDDFMGMQIFVRDKMEQVLKGNTKLTEQEKKSIMEQFLFTDIFGNFEDDDIDDMRSCTFHVTAYSNHSYSSVKLKFEYHFRARVSYLEYHLFLRFGYWSLPSKPKIEDRMWFSNLAENDYVENREFLLVLHDIKKIKELLFNPEIRDKLSNYEVVQLVTESVGYQFGRSGHVSDDDWIGYNHRVLCGCPTENDYNFKHPTFQAPIEDDEEGHGGSFVIPGLGSAPGRLPKGCPQQ